MPHHITQRGNYRQVIFGQEDDYRQYLDWLKYYSGKYFLKIWAYCLMSNHVHFIAVPEIAESMSRTFNTLHMRYAQYVNAKRGDRGHLWQGRYYSCALDEKHLYAAVRYVENNPVRSKLVAKAEDYGWSSARSHVQKTRDVFLAEDCGFLKEIRDWATYLEGKDAPETIRLLIEHTKTGRPCGNERFIGEIERSVGRSLIAKPRGRPRGIVSPKASK
jgi:putative transposase